MADLREFKTSLVYVVHSRTARAIQMGVSKSYGHERLFGRGAEDGLHHDSH